MILHPLASALLGGTALVAAPAGAPAIHLFHADHGLGPSLDATITALASPLAEAAMAAIHAEIARLEPILSGWRGDSELAALNGAPVFAASPDLFNVIAAGEAWRARSGGAFSPRLGALDGTGDAAPLARRIAAADVGLDPATRQIRRPEEVRFAIDAIAKGYIIDRALDAARRVPGIEGVLLDIGGDIACWGQAPCGAGWRIGVADPFHAADNAMPAEMLTLRQGAVASSGAGARGHAIYDPATGAVRQGVALATAVAPTAADADALASALYVLGPQKGLQLAANIPGAAARIVTTDGTVHASDGWSGLVLAQNTRAATPAAASGTPWPAGFGVTIDYTIPAITGGRRVRPPYVTIWISDESDKTVRTLAFYADKLRFMPENYIFWGGIGDANGRMSGANSQLLNSVTKPTRPPGSYSLQWDGKDDAGRPVPQGRYTINIEASREHGGHNMQRIVLDLRAEAASGEAAAQTELGPAKVTYGK